MATGRLSPRLLYPSSRPLLLVAVQAAALLAAAVTGESRAWAQSVKPRFVVVFDTSGSMSESPGRRRTHGDGSTMHPGCDLDNNGLYDDSKLYQAKAALADTITAFGSADFALARYHQVELGQACTTTPQCEQQSLGANVCVANTCGYSPPGQNVDYNECSGGSATTDGCIRCANPATDPTHIYVEGNTCCVAGDPRSGGAGMAGDVLVQFAEGGARNQEALLSWFDGEETFPAGQDRELRATGITPIGASLNAVRDWLTKDTSAAGAGGGVLNRDSKVDCRSYNVILITDGLETPACVNNCMINGTLAADGLYHACTNGGVWDFIDQRCEISGNPANTKRVRVRTYVVGYTVNDPSLNSMAAAGGTGTALLANDQAELTARLGDIIAASIPREKCDCADNTCDDKVDETFPAKGQVCTVGVGRCKRQGVTACASDGNGTVCSSSAAGMCPGTVVAPGAAVTERCGASAGCLAPTPEDCADDDCDGLTDENLSCSCIEKPEVCNGIDDDCNGVTDDIAATSCGLAIGECRPGMLRCAGSQQAVCEGSTTPALELCDGKDNDCDGITDGFGLSCYPQGSAGCRINVSPLACQAAGPESWTCTGICQTGVLTCEGGQCGACQGAVTPRTELACDILDNDCDGQTDEGFGLGSLCGPGMGKPGACKPGTLSCSNSQLTCVGGKGPTDETCNGIDDDCDGQTDNIPGVCGMGLGECSVGRWVCQGTEQKCMQVTQPTPEMCDGKDNDCDGQTDEQPNDPDILTATACGSDEGVCMQGTIACVGGTKICGSSIEASFERCNALDDDCDGKTDESINPPGNCPAPGLAPLIPIVGECRPGVNTCVPDGVGGAAWMCTGGVGPTPEICDGKDNDCNARIDDDAVCPDGMGCASGECVPKCTSGEIECPADRTCVSGLCLFNECVRKPCPYGFYCDPKLGCIDRCGGIDCPQGFVCDNGSCTSCRTTGCPPGQLCRVAACQVDPCAGVECQGGAYCRNGACVATCNGVACTADATSCRDGLCRDDRCTGIICGHGQFCRPSTGACEPNPCLLIACLPGQVCVAAPDECAANQSCTPVPPLCVADPCQVTACKGDDVCYVHHDGVAECLSRDRLPAAQPITRIEAGGSGCACTIGGADARGGGNDAAPVFVLLGAMLGLRVMRRKSGPRGRGRRS